MKTRIFIIILLILSSGTIKAGTSISNLDRNKLIVTGDTITYAGYDNIVLPNGLSLPYQTIYIPVEQSDQISAISTQIIESEQVAIYQDVSSHDIATSSDKNLYANVVSSASFDNLGFNQIQVMDKITIDNIAYFKCMTFPVTLDSNGNAVFHISSQFQIGESVISDNALLSQSQFKALHSSKKESFNRSLSTSAQYLIVTNQVLSESFAQLASYKSETGIKTEIKLIDEILAEQTGRDDAEKLREHLKEFYAGGGQYVLLGGDETVLPIRHAFPNIANSEIDLENQQVCDLYFADLTGDWNADNDLVWGEKYTDSVNLTPELFVGRLPFNQPHQVSQYIEKLIQYETNKNEVDLSYLEKSYFFCSDQMRDYSSLGQHGLIAEALPDYFFIDTTSGVEQSSGNDPNPTNQSSKSLETVLSDGYGIVNIIAHGSSMTFEVRTSNYNDFPKSFFTTDTTMTSNGIVSNLDANNKVSLYISLGCDNGAFDKDQPPFNHLNPSIVETLLSQKNSGAVGFVANTRWGWVGSSHLLQKRFIEYLVENVNQPAIVSLYQMKDDYYYYRDLIYGINYFGDPTMIVHTKKPEQLALEILYNQNEILLSTTSGNSHVENTSVFLSSDGNLIAEYLTDENGQLTIDYQFELGSDYKITATKDGYTINQKYYAPSIATDIDDETNLTLPTSYSLEQNYPNPFNPNTHISFSLPQKTELTLKLYNVLGQEVRTFANGTYAAGIHIFNWDGKDNSGNNSATGIYLYRLETIEFVEQKKMLLLR